MKRKMAMPPLTERERELAQQVLEHIPDFFEFRWVLYIGANVDQFLFARIFEQAKTAMSMKTVPIETVNLRIDVLEKDEDRAHYLRMEHGHWIRRVIIGDVTDINNVKGLKKKYSLIFWAYGPSVIPIEQVWDAIYQLELMANTMVIMVPWGKYNYPEGIEVNPLDKNITEFRPIDFLKRGYAVHCMGPKDERGSNLLAWKTLWVEPWMIVHSDEEGEDE
jgi:hypothetical protein